MVNDDVEVVVVGVRNYAATNTKNPFLAVFLSVLEVAVKACVVAAKQTWLTSGSVRNQWRRRQEALLQSIDQRGHKKCEAVLMLLLLL